MNRIKMKIVPSVRQNQRPKVRREERQKSKPHRQLKAASRFYQNLKMITCRLYQVLFNITSKIITSNLATSVPKSEQSIDEIDTFTHRSVTYQCSCGWEGAEFWSQNPSGVPLR